MLLGVAHGVALRSMLEESCQPPFRTLYIEESRAHTYTRILVTTTDGHPNIPVSRVSERFTHRQVTLRSSNIIRRRHD